MSSNLRKIVIILPTLGLILLAFMEGWSYEFFTLLRFVVCGSTAYVAWLAYKDQQEKWSWLFGAIAILFNPLLPIYLTREIWVVIDFITAIFLLFAILKLKFKT